MSTAASIATLNQQPNLAQLGQTPLADLGFTTAETDFLQTYHPERILVVYGTLAPGRPNYGVIEPVGGEWRAGFITGKLEKEGWGAALGYPGFRPASGTEQMKLDVQVLFADDLVAHWPRLDAFEGEGYQRILTPFELANGEVGVGFIYALREA